MTDQELKEEMIGRLINWKFSQAKMYIRALKRKDSVKCLKLLEKLWGDTGWERGDTIFGEMITIMVEFIRMKEEWTTEEFYNEEQLIDVI